MIYSAKILKNIEKSMNQNNIFFNKAGGGEKCREGAGCFILSAMFSGFRSVGGVSFFAVIHAALEHKFPDTTFFYKTVLHGYQ